MMTILYIPVMAIYKSGDFYGKNTINYSTVQYTLGNLG